MTLLMAQTQKKKTAKRKSKVKKPKVYIPAYKIIVSCAVIITICMGLLLITTITSGEKPEQDSISTQFAQKAEDRQPETEEKQVKSEARQAEPKKSEEKLKKPEEKQKEPEKKQEQAEQKQKKPEKTEQKKSESEKKEEAPVPPRSTEPKKEIAVTVPKPTPAPPPAKTPSVPKDTAAQPAPKPQKNAAYGFPPAKNGAQLVFVFDDGGQNLSHLQKYLDLPFSVTIAVLPQIAHSVESARRIRQSGRHELMLHQPMQAVNEKVNPGPGAIKPGMSEDEIIGTLFQNITEIGPIAGFNNHEGSAITADADMMAVVMRVASQEGIYFLDSRTNVETKVPYVAREMGYSYYERNIFLDNEKTDENALKELRKGLDLANRNGSVIMIGHIWSADFLPAFLLSAYPELVEQGYSFSTVSRSKARKN